MECHFFVGFILATYISNQSRENLRRVCMSRNMTCSAPELYGNIYYKDRTTNYYYWTDANDWSNPKVKGKLKVLLRKCIESNIYWCHYT